jgi:peptidase M28-like protein
MVAAVVDMVRGWGSYYSHGIATPSSAPEPPRRARRGSVERPVNGRLYRIAWLAVALPLLLLAFTVSRPSALPRPILPPTFDADAAAAAAKTLETDPRYLAEVRTPGSNLDFVAGDWFRDQMAAIGLKARYDDFGATIPGTGHTRLRNVVAVEPGRSPQTIVVMAHRDNGANGLVLHRDNAAATAALVQIAQSFTRVRPEHTLVFLSTDGGTTGGLGARHFVEHDPAGRNVVAVVNLDTIATSGRPGVAFSGPGPHSPSPTLLGSALARLSDQTRQTPARPSFFGQLLDLAFPFSLYEQWPFLRHGISAITLTTAGDRPVSDPPAGELDTARLGQVGSAAQALVGSLEQGLELSQGTSSYVYFAGRIIHGWAIALVLIALFAPFAAASVDLFARCRRRQVSLGPAFRAYRRRLGFWLWVGVLFELFARFGAFPGGAAVPPDPVSSAAGDWPRLALLVFVALALGSWLVERRRLVPTRPATAEEELAGQVAALLVLGLIALLVMATNVYALLLFLPSMHAWLWLPQVRGRSPVVRGLVFAAGLIGPVLLLGLMAKRFGMGLDTPWYLAELTAIGYVPIVAVVLALAWVAVAAQLLVGTGGRYAPYPGAEPGFVRSSVRTVVLGVRGRRRPGITRKAYGG